MAKRIAQFIFNRFFSDFTEEYNRCFGDYTPHFRNNVLKDFRIIYSVFECFFEGTCLQIGEHKFFVNLPPGLHSLHISPTNECYIDGKEYENLVNPAQTVKVSTEEVLFILQNIPSNPKNLDIVDRYMNLLLESFRDPKMLELLKAKSDSLILDRALYKKCPIFQHFQLYEIWTKPATKDKPERLGIVGPEEKEIIFKYWLGAYCIAKSVLIIAPEVLNGIEREALENSKSMTSSNSINLTSMKRTGKEMLNHLSNDHIFELYDYLTEAFLAPYTPLYNLIPTAYHPTVTNLRDMWKNQKIRLVIADQIKPLLEDIKKSQRIQGIQVIDEDDDLEAGETDPEKTATHQKARTHAIEYFIDLCIGVVERNQDIINAGAKDPNSIKNFLKQAPNIASLVSRVGQEFREVLKTTNDAKTQSDKAENKEIENGKVDNGKIGNAKVDKKETVKGEKKEVKQGCLESKVQNNYMKTTSPASGQNSTSSSGPNSSSLNNYSTPYSSGYASGVYIGEEDDFVSVQEDN